MELTEFSFRLLIFFLPGLIAYRIILELTLHKKPELSSEIINSLLLGFLCYTCYFFVLGLLKFVPCLPQPQNDFVFLHLLSDGKTAPDFKEVFGASFLAVPIGLISAKLINYYALNKLARALNITNKFGEKTVWGYLLNSSEPTEWVLVRDFENDLMYEGWIQAFSDDAEDNEIFLREAKVFRNSTGEELYETPGLYIAKSRDKLAMEFRNLPPIKNTPERIITPKPAEKGKS